MTWCERCLADHEGPCLDQSARREISDALDGYRRGANRRPRKKPGAASSRRFPARHDPAGPGAGASKRRSRHRSSPEADWLDLHYDVMNRLI